MTTIWSRSIQDLILSGLRENIILGCGLVEDKKALLYWAWLDIDTARELEVPFITMSICREIALQVGYMEEEGNSHKSYLKECYDRHMEQMHSGTHQL